MKCGKRGKFNWWMKFPLSRPRELVEVLKKLRGGTSEEIDLKKVGPSRWLPKFG
ncbi:MAG: hypothetical protein ACTS41_02040 [Candidatus Hodgkinia cicadicola]